MRPAMATAARTPTTIPAIAPPEIVGLSSVLLGALVAEEELAASVASAVGVVAIVGVDEEVVSVNDGEADVEESDLVGDAEADIEDVEDSKAEVLFFTLNDKRSALETWSGQG
jgi:hypothetical protein